MRFLKRYEDERPFFMYVALTAPHAPWRMPDTYRDMYDASTIEVPDNLLCERPYGAPPAAAEGSERTSSRGLGRARRSVADYYAMITYLDSLLGRLFSALKKSGHAKDTIVVFASDNGLTLGHDGQVSKSNLYEQSIRVPLIMRGPGIPKGARRDALCYVLDLYPTLCDLVDAPVPDSVEGRSFAGAVRGSRATARQTLSFAYCGSQRAVRDERYKLTEYRRGDGRTVRLFDLDADPTERTDLAADPQQAVRIARLRRDLLP